MKLNLFKGIAKKIARANAGKHVIARKAPTGKLVKMPLTPSIIKRELIVDNNVDDVVLFRHGIEINQVTPGDRLENGFDLLAAIYGDECPDRRLYGSGTETGAGSISFNFNVQEGESAKVRALLLSFHLDPDESVPADGVCTITYYPVVKNAHYLTTTESGGVATTTPVSASQSFVFSCRPGQVGEVGLLLCRRPETLARTVPNAAAVANVGTGSIGADMNISVAVTDIPANCKLTVKAEAAVNGSLALERLEDELD